ncbi:MAG: LamG domain-containing protein, partial [Planctomycetota bacterium]
TTLNAEDWLQAIPSGGLLGPGEVIDVNVCISANADLLDPNLYTDILTFQNTDSNSIKPRPVTLTIKPPDCFTESFETNYNDLSGLMVTFTPDGTIAYYEACREMVDEFPTDPNGGTYVGLWDDDFVEVSSGVQDPNKKVTFYGTEYDRFYIGSNGYITFGNGDTEYNPSLENHFNMPRISGIFADLNPPNNHCISYKKLGDRVVVTFENVPLWEDKDAESSFQIELFYVDQTVRITWLEIVRVACVAGLSHGRGLPPVFFEQSNLNGYPFCWPLCDFNRDYLVNSRDFAVLAMHWLEEDCGVPYWCGKTDLDFSGKIDSGDTDIFSECWLTKVDWFLQPISHWKFDEGSGDIAYDSVGDNDGFLVGDPCWVAGNITGYALDFDGDDYVDLGSPVSLNISGEITISAWINAGAMPDDAIWAVVSSQDDDNESGASLILDGRENPDGQTSPRRHIHFQLGDGNFHTTNVNAVVPANQWVHIAATRKANEDAIVYYNAVSQPLTSVPWEGTVNYTVDWNIGRYPDRGGRRYFDGKIDDVIIYDRALSAEEVEELYEEGRSYKATAPNPADGATCVDPNTILSWSPGKGAISHDVYFGTDYNDLNDANEFSDEYMGNYDVNSWDPCGLNLDTTYYWRIDEVTNSNTHKGDAWNFTTWPAGFISSLAGWWEFEEGSGTIAYDSSINGNDGTLHGLPDWVSGKIGDYALDFDGDDYVDLGSPSSLNISGEITISAWIKAGAIPDDAFWAIVSSQDHSNTSGIAIVLDGRLNPDGQTSPRRHIHFQFGNGTYWQDYCTTNVNAVVPTDQWVHIVATRRANEDAKVYYNAISQPLTSKPWDGSVNYTADWNIGRMPDRGGRHYFDGKIDDVMIFERALSAEEVEKLYQRGQD